MFATLYSAVVNIGSRHYQVISECIINEFDRSQIEHNVRCMNVSA